MSTTQHVSETAMSTSQQNPEEAMSTSQQNPEEPMPDGQKTEETSKDIFLDIPIKWARTPTVVVHRDKYQVYSEHRRIGNNFYENRFSTTLLIESETLKISGRNNVVTITGKRLNRGFEKEFEFTVRLPQFYFPNVQVHFSEGWFHISCMRSPDKISVPAAPAVPQEPPIN